MGCSASKPVAAGHSDELEAKQRDWDALKRKAEQELARQREEIESRQAQVKAESEELQQERSRLAALREAVEAQDAELKREKALSDLKAQVVERMLRKSLDRHEKRNPRPWRRSWADSHVAHARHALAQVTIV